MQYIPPFLCQIIDAIAFDGDPSEFQEEWSAWKADFDDYYERESDYFLSKNDQAIVANIPPSLQQLTVSVERAFQGQCEVDDLVKDTQDFFTNHDAFFDEREKEYFVPNPPIDRFLKASVAYLQDQGSIEAVLKRIPDAALAVDSIHQLYLDSREELPEELCKGLVDGFQRAQKGFDIMAKRDEAISKEELEEAIFEIRSAGELLSHLPALFRRFEEEEASLIPIVGNLFSILREADENEEQEQLQILREHAWPAFQQLWESRTDGWLMEPDQAFEILPSADQIVFEMAELLPGYPDNEESFWNQVDLMDDLFEQIHDATMDLSELPSSPYWPETQLCLNLLRGAAPIYAAHSIAGDISRGSDVPPVVATFGECLTSFVKQPDPYPLLVAIKNFIEDFELSKTTRICAACHERVPLSAKTCPSCGAKMEELSVSG